MASLLHHCFFRSQQFVRHGVALRSQSRSSHSWVNSERKLGRALYNSQLQRQTWNSSLNLPSVSIRFKSVASDTNRTSVASSEAPLCVWEVEAPQTKPEAQEKTDTARKKLVVPCSFAGTDGFGGLHRRNGTRIGEVTLERLARPYNLCVIGGGPTGVAAAMQAATLGRRVLIVDKPKVDPNSDGLDISFGGPTGLFSKAYREAGASIDVKSLKSMGLYDTVIWGQVQEMCVRMSAMNAEHQVEVLEKLRVHYLQAHATIVGPDRLEVVKADSKWPLTISAENILIATGSKSKRPAAIPIDDNRIFDSDTINSLGYLPTSVTIKGSGIIGIEYAKIFRKFGCKVTMLVRSSIKKSLEKIGLDRDIADAMIQSLRNHKVTIYEGTTVAEGGYDVPTSMKRPIRMTLKSSDPTVPAEIESQTLLVAAGRSPNTHGMGLAQLGIGIDKNGGQVEVNERFQTKIPSIWAAGDVLGPPSLASTGIHQAKSAVISMFDEGRSRSTMSYPVGMWTTPEAAYYGLTKEAAEKRGMRVEEGRSPYRDCLRGRVFNPEGLVKLVFRVDDGVVVGVHLIGADACELVHYVTYHELFKEAALDGNSRLDFGAQWRTILGELREGVTPSTGCPKITDEVLEKLFFEMDRNGDGSLDVEELSCVFEQLGRSVKRGTIANLVRLADTDGNGTIEWNEFKRVFEVVKGSMEEERADEWGLENMSPYVTTR